MNAPLVYDEFMALRTRLLEASIKPEHLRPFVISEDEYRDLLTYMQPHMASSLQTPYFSIHGIKFKVL